MDLKELLGKTIEALGAGFDSIEDPQEQRIASKVISSLNKYLTALEKNPQKHETEPEKELVIEEKPEAVVLDVSDADLKKKKRIVHLEAAIKKREAEISAHTGDEDRSFKIRKTWLRKYKDELKALME
jgi:hypothetical protein